METQSQSQKKKPKQTPPSCLYTQKNNEYDRKPSRDSYICIYRDPEILRYVDIHTPLCGWRWQGCEIIILLFTCNTSISLWKFAYILLRRLLSKLLSKLFHANYHTLESEIKFKLVYLHIALMVTGRVSSFLQILSGLSANILIRLKALFFFFF